MMLKQSDYSQKILARLDYLAGTIGAICVAIFAAMIVYVVFARYVLAYTPRWSEELPRLLLVWATFIGGISAFARRSHLSAGITDLIIKPGRLRNAIALLALLANAVFLLVLVKAGWQLTQATWSHQTTVMSWPGGIIYLALPLTAIISLIALVLAGWRK